MLPSTTITIGAAEVSIEFAGEGLNAPGRAVFVGIKEHDESGCALIPYRQHYEGSTIFLPFAVDRVYGARVDAHGAVETWRREWLHAAWTNPISADGFVRASAHSDALQLIFPLQDAQRANWMNLLQTLTDRVKAPRLIVWAKDLTQNDGWGTCLPIDGDGAEPILGDYALEPLRAEAISNGSTANYRLRAQRSTKPRVRIYQLLPRLFTNTNERRKFNGTVAENGVGKFAEITDSVLVALRDELSVTHLWLTGVLSHATSTAYPEIGQVADDPVLVKGLAGSPYAIKDYGDVSPDYAVDPARRLEEFKALLQRIHDVGLRAIIDFVPNHVARNHRSTLVEFGRIDDRSVFFSPQNNFYWLQPGFPGGGPPLRLPISPENNGAETHAIFDLERNDGRVTGNNAATWSPSPHDWYETAKLNYGYDFTTGRRDYPHAGQGGLSVPDTWKKMDAVLAYWQGLGVDGFRCDMAHMVPPEFWQWAVARARERQPEVFFLGEAYNDDPMKVEGGDPFVGGFHSVSVELLNAGFDAVYDDPAYKALKRIYDGPGWANDLDTAIGVRDGRVRPDYVFQRGLRYGENHDEVRLASRGNWANAGVEVGRPVCAVLFALSRGPVLLYSGQEVGEPAEGAEGYGGDDGRTTIFDYWSMPELANWVNDHRFDGARLSRAQRDLRAYYGRLLKLLDEPAFRDGDFMPLNPHNVDNPDFGRLPGESASGHWLYAFIRHDRETGQAFLVLGNLHPTHTFQGVRIRLPGGALDALCGKRDFRIAGARSTLEIPPSQSRLVGTLLQRQRACGPGEDMSIARPLVDRLSCLEAAQWTEPSTISVSVLPPLSAGYFLPRDSSA